MRQLEAGGLLSLSPLPQTPALPATARLAVQLPAGAGSPAARECRIALREGAGGPVRKEVGVPLSEGPSGARNPPLFFPSPTTGPTHTKAEHLRCWWAKKPSKITKLFTYKTKQAKWGRPFSLSNARKPRRRGKACHQVNPHWQGRHRTAKSRNILRKENEVGGITLPGFSTTKSRSSKR